MERNEPDSVHAGMVRDAAQAAVPETLDHCCPFCCVLTALPSLGDENPASAHCCTFHRPLWRRLLCQGWNAERAHQVRAGKARAQQFTTAHQRAAGQAAFTAFSARWRAAQGLAPLSAEAVGRYLLMPV
jgi:hypothetical protein